MQWDFWGQMCFIFMKNNVNNRLFFNAKKWFLFCSEIWEFLVWLTRGRSQRSILSYPLTHTRTGACQWPYSSAKTCSIQTSACVTQTTAENNPTHSQQHKNNISECWLINDGLLETAACDDRRAHAGSETLNLTKWR